MRKRGSFAGGALVLVVRVTPPGAEPAESILPLRLVGVGGLPLADGRHSQAEGLTTLHRKLGFGLLLDMSFQSKKRFMMGVGVGNKGGDHSATHSASA